MIKRCKVKAEIDAQMTMILSFHPCFVTDTQIILGSRGLKSDDRDLIREADAIILPQICSFDLYQACQNSNALLFPDYKMRFEYPGKIGQSLLFRELKVPHPETKQWTSVETFRKTNNKGSLPHKTPFFIKADNRHEAEGVYLITDRSALESSLDCLIHLEESGLSGFVSQEFIPSGGNVRRAVVLEKKIITYWKRPQNPGEIITTINHVAKIDRDWRSDLQEKGEAQARRFSIATGINLAAIDIVFPLSLPDPQPLFLEINYYFGRRGLGGSIKYYDLLFKAIQEWLIEKGFDPKSITLV